MTKTRGAARRVIRCDGAAARAPALPSLERWATERAGGRGRGRAEGEEKLERKVDEEIILENPIADGFPGDIA